MSYISLSYAFLVAVCFICYYILPKNIRWISLLVFSAAFFYLASSRLLECILFFLCIALCYVWGRILEKHNHNFVLFLSILTTGMPLFIARLYGFIPSIADYLHISILIPIGLSFWSLQMLSYLIDVKQNKIESEKNPLKLALFLSFFPQIIQGPIPRYSYLATQLYEGHSYNRDRSIHGLYLVLFGLFLKLMIADKAGIFVDTVFSDVYVYQGTYIWIAGFLYSIQLYADFMACTVISIGTAALFGITLQENFKRPYFATGIQDFWRRWHISLSGWLRDYVYIPLGGSRKGNVRRGINILITFAVSGIWHGIGFKYLVWGLLHGAYQIIGGFTKPLRDRLYEIVHIQGKTKDICKCIGTFFLVMIGWIIFRADTLTESLFAIRSMFTKSNGWVMFNGSLTVILPFVEWVILFMSMLVLFFVSYQQEKGVKLIERFDRQSLIIRWIILILVIVMIWVFGTYGYGYNVQDFIYGGF